MIANEIIADSWRGVVRGISADIFKYSMVKPLPSVWVESNMILPSNTSRYPGPYSYDKTPYWIEPINHLHESSPVRYITIIKSVQCGATAGVVIPGILYIIACDPDNTLFTAGDLMLAKKTIEERLDTILRESRLDHLIRPHAVKKANQRTGDTAASKEYSGGTLTALGTGSANSFRYYSAKKGFVDDFDTAPRDLGGEGSVKSLIEGRQNSFGDTAQTFFISTPTETATSNIWEQYQLGTQKKWNWPCYNCGAPMQLDWQIHLPDNSYAGMVWTVDGKGHLNKNSVGYRCQHCGELTYEKEKYERNLNGLWIPTVEAPAEDNHESYSTNAIFQPPGFTGWVKLVQEWLKANPATGKPNVILLKSFNNLRLGLPFEELGATPKATALMQNIREYAPGTVPDETCLADGNGKIIMLTLACDLGGIMDDETEDVRLDWEILAHSQAGATYSVDQGSIGTFKRQHEKSKFDKAEDETRKKWTYTHNSICYNNEGVKENNSVWAQFEEIIKRIYIAESGAEWDIMVTVVDTGFFEKMASAFVIKMQDEGLNVFGIKGRVDLKYRPLQRDSEPVRRSTEKPKQLYNVEVNQMKDDLADNMSLQLGDGGVQPSGFMNFPQQTDGKYSYSDFFKHFEAEARKPETNQGGDVVGYKWVKKNSTVANHFWDVRVYNLVAPLIYLDLVRQSESKYRKLSWEEFVIMITE